MPAERGGRGAPASGWHRPHRAVVAWLTARKAAPVRGHLGLHLRRRRRLVGHQLHDDLQDPGAAGRAWPPPSARTRRPARCSARAPHLQTVAGFTVFKISMTLMVLGAVWGLLTSTRLLRGEEDAGRWELLLAGQTTRAGAAVQALGGLAAGVVTLWALTAAAHRRCRPGLEGRHRGRSGALLRPGHGGRPPSCSWPSAPSPASWRRPAARPPPTRPRSSGLSYAVRMVADAGVGLHGLIWASPLGWVEELQPLTAPQPLALLPIVGFTAVLAVVAVHLAGDPRRRGEHRARPGDAASPHLGCSPGRRAWPSGWSGPPSSAGGRRSPSRGCSTGSSPSRPGATISGSSVRKVFSKLGAPGTGADAVLGVCFLILAVLVAFVGRRPGHRGPCGGVGRHGSTTSWSARSPASSWLGGRLLVAVVVLLAQRRRWPGIFTWLGAASQHAGVSFTTLLGAGVNLVPPAVSSWASASLAIGVWPRAHLDRRLRRAGLVAARRSSSAASAPSSHWVLDTSVFHQMASAPAVPPHWAAERRHGRHRRRGALVGGIAFNRRDLQGE